MTGFSSNGNCTVRHLQAHKIWREIHHHFDSRSAFAIVSKPEHALTIFTGDGIGAEVAESVKTIFKADNVPIEWEQVDVTGVETGDKHSEELFRESIASLKRNKLGLKGIFGRLDSQTTAEGFKASCTRPSNAPATSPSTLPCGKSSIYTLLLS